ncbi:MAG: hypothetical protein ACK5KT_17610 [Dysgonomonas sp.]
MKKLVFCCLLVFILMACGEERNNVLGRWSMEFESEHEPAYSLLMPDDSICTSDLLFSGDTVYMQVKSDGRLVENEFVGKYTIKDNLLKLTNRYGKQKECIFFIEGNVMIVTDKDEPDKIIMRLRRIEE